MFRIKSTIIAIIFVDSNDEKAGRDGCGKEKKLLLCQEGRSCPFPRGGVLPEGRKECVRVPIRRRDTRR